MAVELKVIHHPSGRYTLMERDQSEMTPHDCSGDLLGNSDAVVFYRAVAKKMADLEKNGIAFLYQDAPD